MYRNGFLKRIKRNKCVSINLKIGLTALQNLKLCLDLFVIWKKSFLTRILTEFAVVFNNLIYIMIIINDEIHKNT